MVEQVSEHINFPQAEEGIQKLWSDIDAFQTSLKLSKGRPRYSFYDGPPFATGLPHYGHILAGTIKDTVTRYAHMTGHHVDRRFGWDCHGLPVEYEIDKTLGITGPEDIAKMGIPAYNAECRKIVMRYSSEWRTIVTRMGRWIDFDNDYKTLYPSFMESVWWVFKQLYDKNLVYNGYKVMPFSTACLTPLSNFEANQNYKEVVDPTVIVSFPINQMAGVSFIAWTTTPWTLPSNLALCVNAAKEYVKVLDTTTKKVHIMMEARVSSLYKKETEYEVLDKFNGAQLEGLTYEPLFPYFRHFKARGAFKVCCDNYVTEESGTGIVHQAPFFGADDYRVCIANGVIAKDGEIACPVNASGKFTKPVDDFLGMYVKDADKAITKMLKANDRLVYQGSTKHSYPFCWRSDTPLIYKAVPSWFIRVEEMTDKLLRNNSQCYWVPEFVRTKRFHNWLRDAHDWAVSRSRYWGTPIPLWASADLSEIVCVGSIEELESLTGEKVTDLHRESIDHLEIPSKTPSNPPLRRIAEVFDCWFESGSMPYAQVHYPFENKEAFEDVFPADFIAEGMDQTRGWFYTLLVLSTALFNKPPFKNLIVNGLVLASDGQKMSKRKKNYPDPMEIVHKYGADALRLYLVNSPVVRGECLRFKPEGVHCVVKEVFLPWYNAYRFLVQNIIRLYNVVPRLVKFVDQLTNWYVRSNRRRLRGERGVSESRDALQTLFSVVYTMCTLMASFTPFITELMYQNLKHILSSDLDDESRGSVHYQPFPQPRMELVHSDIERAVARMQSVIELGRVIRDRNTMPIKYPLRELVVINRDQQCLDDVTSLQPYILEELNVKMVTVTSDKDKYGVILKADLDFKALGSRLKGDMKKVAEACKLLTENQLLGFQSDGQITVCGHLLSSTEMTLSYAFSTKSQDGYEAHGDDKVLILLDVTPDQTMVDEGVAREVVNRIQKLRKKAKLMPQDAITVHYCTDGYLGDVARQHEDYIFSFVKQPFVSSPIDDDIEVLITETTTLKNSDLKLSIVKGHDREAVRQKLEKISVS